MHIYAYMQHTRNIHTSITHLGIIHRGRDVEFATQLLQIQVSAAVLVEMRLLLLVPQSHSEVLQHKRRLLRVLQSRRRDGAEFMCLKQRERLDERVRVDYRSFGKIERRRGSVLFLWWRCRAQLCVYSCMRFSYASRWKSFYAFDGRCVYVCVSACVVGNI